jgi:tRNA dimethylallyltransferase
MRLAIVGPTAVGKSAVAHELALDLGDVEIATVDSMTVYREMDIGTAKATSRERREVRYHLLDLVDPADEYTVAEFQRAAAAVEVDVAERGRRLIMVGGTGLYGRAVIDRLTIPPSFPELRERLEREADDDLDGLYARLSALDPVAAELTGPSNRRRIVRALEVTEGSSRRFSSYGPGLREYPQTDVIQIGVRAPATLDEAIAARFLRWLDEGLLDEVRRLAERPRGLSRTARQAAGYRELLAHVEGDLPLDRAIDEAIVATRRLARRQRKWFERDPRIQWCDSPAEAAARARALLSRESHGVED